MNSSSSSSSCGTSSGSQSTAPPPNDGKKIRKPYTITKSRESWTDEEHDKFLEALQLFDRDWKKIEDFVGSKTVIQIRSHAQKYFLKVQKNGTVAHVPPPRPKRKAAHPYPQKAPKTAPLLASMSYPSSSVVPGYCTWDDASMLTQYQSGGIMSHSDEYNHHGIEELGNSSIGAIGGSNRTMAITELPKHRNEGSVLHGIPDFAEVYNFIGNIFDPETEGHIQKLKEMDPINFETVLLLMKNLTVNLSSPDFEPFKKVLSSYDVDAKAVGNVVLSPNSELSC